AAPSETGNSELVVPIGVERESPAVVVESSGTPCVFKSSFRHTRHLNRIVCSKSQVVCWMGGATRNREHSTGLRSCKAESQDLNLGCFVNDYTTNGRGRLSGNTITCAVPCRSL